MYLRKDLERVRTLTEMVRKREKEKLCVYKLQNEYFESIVYPVTRSLVPILDQLKK